ncbi:MAG: hypothetical protein EXS24_06075 [Pedosphaera sp.]|nr:hypothetical protein [Pedosphaera sp.]
MNAKPIRWRVATVCVLVLPLISMAEPLEVKPAPRPAPADVQVKQKPVQIQIRPGVLRAVEAVPAIRVAPAVRIELDVKAGLAPVPFSLPEPVAQAPVPVRNGTRPESVELLNGDIFSGDFVSYDAKDGLRWKHPSIKNLVDFDSKSISILKLKSATLPATAKRHSFNVKMHNGDELNGDVTELDASKVTLQTWYAGTLSIPRAAVKSITPRGKNGKLVYEGPDGIQGWVSGNRGNRVGINGVINAAPVIPLQRQLRIEAAVDGVQLRALPAIINPGIVTTTPNANEWKFHNGGFVATGAGSMIGRDFETPDRVNIEFDIHWQGYFSFQTLLFTDKFEQYGGKNYSLQINASSCYLNRNSPELGSMRVGNAVIGRTNLQNPKTSAHISIRVDKKEKVFALFVDDVLIQQWKDNQEFAGKGKGLMFVSQSAAPMKVSQIRIMEWDGAISAPADQVTGNGKEDFLRLGNSDTMSGTVKAYKDGKVIFANSFAALEIPIERVGLIELATPAVKPAPLLGESRATFQGYGKVSFQLQNWKDGKVTMVSPTFGSAVFDATVFSAIEFNTDKTRTTVKDPIFGRQ